MCQIFVWVIVWPPMGPFGICSSFKNLCAKIPENVDDKAAVFTVVGAIGLHKITKSNTR